MAEELGIHSNITCIPQDEFEKCRGYWYYASYEMNKTLQMLDEVQHEYDEEGNRTRGSIREEYTFTKEQVQEMESNLKDLYYRLHKMFIEPNEALSTQRSERIRQLHAEGKIPKRGPKKDRIKRKVR